MTPPAPPALTAAEERELDALLGKLLLPSFTPREVEIASATARAVLAHVRAALAAPPPDAVQPPPADAKEWTCRQCGGDVLWCKCPAPPDAGLVALVRSLPEWDKDGYCVFDCGAHRVGASRDGNEVMAHIIYDHATEKVEHRRCGYACQQHAVTCYWRTLQAALPARPTEPTP